MDDWTESYFNDWKPMFNYDSVIRSERDTMPLSFAKTLASILSLPVTHNCPECEWS